MTERPILFSGPMVRAILAGRKTQTRRVVKLPHNNPLGAWEPTTVGGKGVYFDVLKTKPAPEMAAIWHTRTGDCLISPYGQVGSILWVRETWQCVEGTKQQARIVKFPTPPARGWIEYAATPSDEPPPKWRPSIHMPRWACRITLEITGVRVERLQGIDATDAVSEGVEVFGPGYLNYGDSRVRCWFANPIDSYRSLWESIHGPGSWAANPWVWVVEFKRVKG